MPTEPDQPPAPATIEGQPRDSFIRTLKLTAEVFRRNQPLSLALCTALAYSLAYRYHKGYLAEFGIPPHFVTVTLTRLVTTALALCGLLLITTIALTFATDLWHDWRSSRNTNRLVIRAIMALAIVAISAVGDSRTLAFATISLIFALWCLCYALLIIADEKTPPWIMIVLGSLFLLLAITTMHQSAQYLGEHAAHSKSTYSVIPSTDSEDTLVVVDTYDGNLLCVQFDPQTREFLPVIRIVDPAQPAVHLHTQLIPDFTHRTPSTQPNS